jgi:Ni/Fe-hydrogenase 1 B-type cytochrome subunit
MMTYNRIRVYAFEFPVRFSHWINFLCITAFIATGLYIGNPYAHANDSSAFLMGYMRYLHFITGYAFACSLAIRVYWAFAGNRYASWRVWFPFTPMKGADVLDAVKFYTFMSRKPPYSIGHTALAGLTYFVVFIMFLFQIVSGFALYSLQQPSLLPMIFGGWLTALMEVQTIRLLHHLCMYLIFAFVCVHIYISWWLDTVERNGLMDGIFSGHKFVTGKEWE